MFQLKCKNNVSTRYSKCLDEAGKSNRKRFKQGEKLRPQPKELLEIVPNKGKVISSLISYVIPYFSSINLGINYLFHLFVMISQCSMTDSLRPTRA